MRGIDSSYANHVRSLYSGSRGYEHDRLFGAGEAVQSLTRHPGWSVLMDLLSAEREDIRSRLEGSRPLEASQVQHLLGQLRGVNAAELAASAVTSIHRVELEEQQRKHERAAEPARA